MRARADHSCTVPDIRGYTSTRVFNGVRPLTEAAKKRHAARVQKMMAKRKAKKA